jgi:EpsD family peptidyl-prolyl cis-trans isomerase
VFSSCPRSELRRTGRRCAHLLVALCIGIVAGCGRNDDRADDTQVAARVNGDKISVRQVEYALMQKEEANDRPGSPLQARRRVLDMLIDEKLASQQAVKNKLDRTPAAIAALDLARTEVLARTFVQSIVSAQAMPTTEEVDKYYVGHPELFAQRRVFDLDEIMFTAADPVKGVLRDVAAAARSMQDIADWLNARGIKFTENRVVRAAEQVPLDVLPKLQAMTEGRVELVGAVNGRFHLVQVVASKTVPVDRTTAAPRIREFLRNQRVTAAVATEMARLKGKSKIEYVGDYAAQAAPGEPGSALKVPPARRASPLQPHERGKEQTE